jgi:hypothetical protein
MATTFKVDESRIGDPLGTPCRPLARYEAKWAIRTALYNSRMWMLRTVFVALAMTILASAQQRILFPAARVFAGLHLSFGLPGVFLRLAPFAVGHTGHRGSSPQPAKGHDTGGRRPPPTTGLPCIACRGGGATVPSLPCDGVTFAKRVVATVLFDTAKVPSATISFGLYSQCKVREF